MCKLLKILVTPRKTRPAAAGISIVFGVEFAR